MADVEIIGLPAAPSAITGTEIVPIVQNGLTVQTTVAAITASPSQTQPFLTVSQQPTLPNSRYFSTGTGLGITDGGAQGAYTIAFNGTSGSLESAGTGIVVKTAANTITARSFAVSGSGLSLSNGDGISGNPTLSLSGLPLALANASGSGLLALNGSSLSPVTLTGTSNQISVINGTGSGNPTIGLVSNPVIPGTASLTLPVGTTAQRDGGANGEVRFNSDLVAYEGFAAGAWRQFSLSGGVFTFSAGSTGFAPSSPTAGVVTLSGILNSTSGGTGASALTGYLYGNGASPATASTTIPTTNLSGTISNAQLANSSITINGSAISLGGSTSVGTVTAVTGTAPVVSSGGTTPAISMAAANTTTNGYLTSTDWNTFNGKGSGSVTSVSFTGGLISVATATTTPTLTVAGTSGGLVYFSSASTWASSAVLAANALIIGGGAGVAPSTITTGTGVVTALGVNTGSAGAFVVNGGALGTPSSGTVTNLTGTASININGTVGATTANTGAFTTLSASSTVSGTGFSTYLASPPAIGGTAAAAGTFTTLTNTGTAYLGGASSNQSLQVNNVASAVNYAQIVGAIATAAPTISAQGSDANIGLVLNSKGTGVVALGGSTVANSGFVVAPVASSVNWLQVQGSITTNSPIISALGTDANIAIALRAKGLYNTTVQSSAGANIHDFSPVASSVNFLRSTAAIATGAPALSAQGSDTNINLNLTPKGTGVVYTASSVTAIGGIFGGSF